MHIQQIYNKVLNKIRKGYISLSNSDSSDYPTDQVTYQGKQNNSLRVSPYGLDSRAPEQTLVMIKSIGGEENLCHIPYACKERFKDLKKGEVVVGSPKTGSYVKFLENGDIEISSEKNIIINASKVIINSEDLEHNGSSFKTNAKVSLGSGGEAIARKGDQVTVGSNTGTITGGSSYNTSA